MGSPYFATWDEKRAYEDQQRAMNHAIEMDKLDRANQMAAMEKILGVFNGQLAGGGMGGGNSSSGYLGLGDAEFRLKNLLDDPDSIKKTGAYKFRVGQGQEALERSLGAKGMLNSGNRLTELTKYGQDMGSQEYENQFSRLSSLLGNYQTSADRRYDSTMGSLSGLMGGNSWGGKTGDIWSAYTGAGNTAVANKSLLPKVPNETYFWPSGSITAGGR